ncbi:glycoside hydrolase family 3 C-terminal domain-containing protein [Streptomyces sp. BE230]|uniref:glycoside hydrolase family 3 C-terminal domain-containing protein n=1 Tax=Streptomyces sp. BE230 TaxID=3002526 RepID=UPI002ED299C2|nr:glycoside hydrolase family 3 C-terminal domain-containing protein [Streptomyces sp. BE230]
MTLDEKAAILHQYAPALDRLGLPPFRLGTEVLHGLCFVPGVTVFPQSVGLGATWNPSLIAQIGSAVADEVRRLHVADPAVGLNVWGPVVNLLRDPRWGRNEEGFSEDALLTARMAIAYCQGLRGDLDEPSTGLKTTPTLKHFLAYNHISEIGEASSQLRPRVLREYDLKPFELAVRSGAVSAVMASYNKVNSRPSHLSPYFQLLHAWQPNLVVVADAFGPIGLVEDTHYYDDRPHAYAAALRAGLDSFTCENENPEPTMRVFAEAMAAGLLGEQDIDTAAARVLRMRLSVAEVDPDAADPEEACMERGRLALDAARQSLVLLRNQPIADQAILPIEEGRIRSLCLIGLHAGQIFHDWYSAEPSREVTLREALVARLGAERVDFVEGLNRVALEVETDSGTRRLGIADNGNGPQVVLAEGECGPEQQFDLLDWGEGNISIRCVATGLCLAEHKSGVLLCDRTGPSGWTVKETFELIPEAGAWLLRNKASGRHLSLDLSSGQPMMTAQAPAEATRLRRVVLDSAVECVAERAAAADAVVVAVGTHPLVNGGERADRMHLGLPDSQQDAVRAAIAANPTTAVVVVSGHPVTSADLLDELPALLWSNHAGQESGNALADVLLGRHEPRGRLPQTWYRSESELGDLFDYDIIKSGKTYQYFDGVPQFPFGHGLSYTDFAYLPLRLSATAVTAEDRVEVTVEIVNRGQRTGTEVVQLYACAPAGRKRKPLRQLVGFQDVTLGPGESADVVFTVEIGDLARWEVSRHAHRVPAGRHSLMAGSSSLDIRATVELTVLGEADLPRDLTASLVRAADFDDYGAIRLVDEMRVGGDAVEPVGDQGWLSFESVDLRAGKYRLVARLRGSERPGRAELCLSSPDSGKPLAVIDVPVAADPMRWHTYETEFSVDEDGVQDIYLLLHGPIRLAAFGLAR